MLTGKQLIEQGIITGPIEESNIQQHGVDLNVVEVHKLWGGGSIFRKSPTQLGIKEKITPRDSIFVLQPGVYDFTFKQGCKIPPNYWGEIIQRSSLSRNGTFIRSAIFDAGFETKNIGTIVTVMLPIHIEVGARIGQFVVHASNEVKNLYNGQWQNDKQRGK